MQSAGLSEGIILSCVDSQPAADDTSMEGLLALKKAGVLDAVVAAMISRNAAMKAGGANPTGTNLLAAAPAGPPAGVDEVGAYYQDKHKAWHLIPSEIVNTRSGASSRARSPMASSRATPTATSRALRARPS